jgi:Activator of Hsp90 ATPase homolog 1-like protein
LTLRQACSRWSLAPVYWKFAQEPTLGESKVGGALQFRFGAVGIDMKVLELHPAKHVLWQVVDEPQEWIGTKVSWELKQEGHWTIVLFRHQGWKEPVEFMHHCSTK